MARKDTEKSFEVLIKGEMGAWPEGCILEVACDRSKQPDVERDHYICTLTDYQGAVIGKWAGVEKQKMYAPFSSFSVSRLAD